MTTPHRFYPFGLAALLAGCATTPMVLEPVGPAPLSRDALIPKGYLQVYTATEAVLDGDNTYYYPHTDYSVHATNGTFVMRVKNASFHRDETPATVTLPVGTYRVKAPGLIVSSAVERGKTTVIHLDGDWRPDRPREEINDGDLVRMPNGHVVGWRARTSGIADAK